MKHSLICVVMVIVMTGWLLPSQSFAQGTDVGIIGAGLLSVQPIDDGYVGNPYLSEGIGGFGPGFGVGVDAIFGGGLVVAAEYTTARFQRVQQGRLVTNAFPDDSATTRLRDSMLTGLVGYALGGDRTRVLFLGGAGVRLDNPTLDGEPREPLDFDHDPLPIVPTGGVDVLHSLNSRTSVIVGARYFYDDRPENHRYLGVGPHILRTGAGIRVGLTNR